MTDKIHILFLCTGNSCRSQMAEGWARHLKADVVTAVSAGVESHGMNRYAQQVMAEAGVPLDGHYSKTTDELAGHTFDYVVTVCDNARERCPVFPATVAVVHRGFDDPPALTRDMTDEEDILAVYRRVRDEIRAFVETLPDSLRSLA